MPRGTFILGPLAHFELTGSAGNGVRSVDPSYVAQGLLTPFVTVESQDVGLSHTPTTARRERSLTAKIQSVFRTHSDEDLLFDPTAGRSTLASGSTRLGWAGSARALGPFFDVAANATAVEATFDDTHLLVPYVPNFVVRGDAALFHDLPVAARSQADPRRRGLWRELRRPAPAPLQRAERRHLRLRRLARSRLGNLEGPRVWGRTSSTRSTSSANTTTPPIFIRRRRRLWPPSDPSPPAPRSSSSSRSRRRSEDRRDARALLHRVRPRPRGRPLLRDDG